MRKNWSDDEVNFIIDNHYKLTNKQIAISLNRSLSSVEGKINRFLTEKIVSNPWSEEDIVFLKENYYRMPLLEIAEKLQRTYSSIITKANKLGISKSLKWDDDEISLFYEVYPKYPNAFLIEKYFPHRNKGQLIMMAQKLKISKDINIGSFGHKNIFEPTGDICLSYGERAVIKYFYDNGINFEKEVLYRNYIKDERCRNFRFDWKCGDYFIEYFGLYNSGVSNYKEKANLKMDICSYNKLKTIFLFNEDLSDLNTKLKILKIQH